MTFSLLMVFSACRPGPRWELMEGFDEDLDLPTVWFLRLEEGEAPRLDIRREGDLVYVAEAA